MDNRILLIVGLLVVSIATTSSALDNGLAITPPMGWISWERFTCDIDCNSRPNDCINSRLYTQMADRLHDDGFQRVGYEYVNIDDCWSELERSTTDDLVADQQRFPEGIPGLANYIHERKLKLGIYGDCGTKTCAGYPAQLHPNGRDFKVDNYFEQDARLFNEWEIDSFKFDGCNIDPFEAESVCPQMASALNATKREILLTCEWPFYILTHRSHQTKPNFSLAKKSCNLWRYYEDVEDSWLSILSIINFSIEMQYEIAKYHGPGGWFDPDQLVIGNFGLSEQQARAQMAIWSIWSAPLFMSNDLRSLDNSMANILKNEKVIAIDQDPMGVFGLMVAQQDNNSTQAFVKPILPIINGCPSFAIVYLYKETLGSSREVTFKVRDLLSRSPMSLAAQRHAQWVERNKNGEELFSAEQCKRKLASGMTKQPTPDKLLVKPANQQAKPVEESIVHYEVDDLFGDHLDANKVVALDSELSLKVNPNGVRMVVLKETKEAEKKETTN